MWPRACRTTLPINSPYTSSAAPKSLSGVATSRKYETNSFRCWHASSGSFDSKTHLLSFRIVYLPPSLFYPKCRVLAENEGVAYARSLIKRVNLRTKSACYQGEKYFRVKRLPGFFRLRRAHDRLCRTRRAHDLSRHGSARC